MPAGELPDNYGIAEREYPTSFPSSSCIRSPSSGRYRERPAEFGLFAIIVKQASPAAAGSLGGRADLHFIHEFAVKWLGPSKWPSKWPCTAAGFVEFRVAFRRVSMTALCVRGRVAHSALHWLSAALILAAVASPAVAEEPIAVYLDQARVLKLARPRRHRRDRRPADCRPFDSARRPCRRHRQGLTARPTSSSWTVAAPC